MRRLIAYIVLVVSMLGLVLFNVQSSNESLNFSQEFDQGTEVVYQINGAGNEQLTNIDIDYIVQEMGDRLESAGATNYTIQQSNDGDTAYQVRIVLGTRNTSDLDNILRSVSSSGNFSIFTTDGTYGTNSNPIIENTAEVFYNQNNQAYIRVEVTEEVQTVYEMARDEVGNGLLVLWQGKTDDLDYIDLSDPDYISSTFEQTGTQLQSKVLAVIDTSETTTEEGTDSSTTVSQAIDRNWRTTTGGETPSTGDGTSTTVDNSNFTVEGEGNDATYYLTFAAYGYADNQESQTAMNANSAHSFERMFNQTRLDEYEITEIYRQRYDASYGENALFQINLTLIVSVVLVSLFLLISYGMMAVSGVVGLSLTALADIMILNLFNITFNPLTVLAVVCTLGFGVNMLCVYYRRLKDEVYQGRQVSKASVEGFRKTISTAIDTTVIFFVLGIVLSLIARQSILSFTLFFIFSSLLSVILVFILSRVLNHFLFNSKIGNNYKLYRINEDEIDFDGDKQIEVKENTLQKIDPKKTFKPFGFGLLATTLLSAVVLLGFGLGSTAFNFTNFEPIGRIEVRTTNEYLFREYLPSGVEFDSEATQIENFVTYIQSLDENINVTDSWIITDQANPFEDGSNYLYFYCDLEQPLDINSDAFVELENFIITYDDGAEHLEPIINSYTVYPGVVVSDFLNTFTLLGTSLAIVCVYFFIRYRFTYVISSLVSIIGGSLLAIGLVSLFRIEATVYVGGAILAGTLLSLLFLIPTLISINQAKAESKVKITTVEQRLALLTKAYKRNVNQLVLSFIGFILLSLILIPCSPVSMLPIYLVFAMTLLINGILVTFFAYPFAYYLEGKYTGRVISERKAKRLEKKRNKIAQQNRNRGAEPEEIIIPGIND